jgi:4-amino-4-deoxy-L-arabinose transferase-like glycosyltransferase
MATDTSDLRATPAASANASLISERQFTFAAMLLIGLSTIFRLWFCAQVELFGDEAYYWVWSRNLACAYFSKPPAVAWVIAAGTSLFGDTEFGVRVFSVLLAAGTGLGMFHLGAMLFSARVGFWAAAIAGFMPLFVVGSLLMTVDAISVLGWTLAAVAFWRFRETRSISPWTLIGLAIGLGVLGKLTILAMIPSLILFVAWSPQHRHLLRSLRFWAMTLVAISAIAPILYWNQQHGWITFHHLMQKGNLDQAWRFSTLNLLGFLGGQAGVMFPLFFVGLMIGLFHRGFRSSAPEQIRYLTALFAPLFVFYFILSLNRRGGENWTAPCYVAGAVYLAAFADWLCRRSVWARRSAVISVSVAASTVAVLLFFVLYVHLPMQGDFLERIRGGRSLAEQVAAIQRRSGATYIIGNHYQTASLLAFYTPGHPRTYTPQARIPRNQYDLWPWLPPAAAGSDAIYVTRGQSMSESLANAFERIDPPEVVWTTFRGKRERPYSVFVCRNMRVESLR